MAATLHREGRNHPEVSEVNVFVVNILAVQSESVRFRQVDVLIDALRRASIIIQVAVDLILTSKCIAGNGWADVVS